MVSNSGRSLVKKILDTLGLEPGLFDVIVTGTDVELKPMALQEIGCDKAVSVYVGDRYDAEIRPAHEVGLRTILLARSTIQNGDIKWADVVIHDITEVEAALESM